MRKTDIRFNDLRHMTDTSKVNIYEIKISENLCNSCHL